MSKRTNCLRMLTTSKRFSPFKESKMRMHGLKIYISVVVNFDVVNAEVTNLLVKLQTKKFNRFSEYTINIKLIHRMRE